MIRLIGLSGYKQSGKSTVAKIIQTMLQSPDDTAMGFPTWKMVQFAGKLKEFVSGVTAMPVIRFEDEKTKNKLLDSEWQDASGTRTYRWLLQHVGTEVARQIHPNFWVNALFSEVTGSTRWIITDCRFPNEAQAIKDRGGIVVRITNDMQLNKTGAVGSKIYEYWSVDQHASEISLDKWHFDDYIFNDGKSLVTLQREVEKMLNHFNIT